LVACGGDGTVHEVTNGMMYREDGIRLPIAIIPNGSGNDMGNSIGVTSTEQALDYICSRTVAKFDLMRAIADVEQGAEVPMDWAHMRYFNNSTSFGLPPKIAIHAKPFKACCGTGAYKIAAIKLGVTCNAEPDKFKVTVDGREGEAIETTMLFCTNSKWLGFMVLNPFALTNDGMLDVCWLKNRDEFGLGGIGRMLKAGADGGLQVY